MRVEVERKVLERAECNAIICDDDHGKRPKRSIPKRIARLVLERAQHRCQVPGCRSSKHLTIHHIKFFSHGGTHQPSNLVVLCDGHHRLLHDGVLQITGRAPDELTFTRNGAPMRAMNDNVIASARTLLAEDDGCRTTRDDEAWRPRDGQSVALESLGWCASAWRGLALTRRASTATARVQGGNGDTRGRGRLRQRRH